MHAEINLTKNEEMLRLCSLIKVRARIAHVMYELKLTKIIRSRKNKRTPHSGTHL